MPLPSPDYANPGGTGDRTADITVTTTDGLVSQSPSNLVDGLFGNTGTEAVSFAAGSTAGVFIRFDFGYNSSRQITEARWKQSSTHSHGIFQWRGSDDLLSFTDIGAPFTLGGSVSQLQTELSTNETGYRYYELLGISGTLSINPYVQEIEFKIAPTIFDGKAFVPNDGAAGDSLTKLSDTPGDYGFRPVRRVYPMPSTGILAEWYFDEGEGDRVRNIRSGDGSRDIVFDSAFCTAYNSSPEWSRKGLLLQTDMVQTSSALPSVRTVATLYRLKHGDTGLILSGGSSSGAGVLGEAVTVSYEHWVANGSGIAPLVYEPTVGNAAYRLNRGGWLLIFTEFDAAYTTKLGWGGVHSQVSTTNRAAELEVAWSACWSGQLNDEDREAIFLSVRRVASERDIYIHWRDCPDYIDCVPFWGQSGITGYSLISGYSPTGDLSAADQARVAVAHSVLISHAIGSSGEWTMAEPFQFKYNHRAQGLLDSRMGPLPGAAWAHEDNRTARLRKLLVNQSAQDSTSLSIGYAPSMTWNVAYLAPGTGMLAAGMRHWWRIEQYLLLQGVGPRLRALWYFQGEEDSIDTVQSGAYGTNLADLWDATKLYLGTPTDFTMKLVKTPVLTSLAGFDTTANNEVRAAQIAFANTTADVTLIDGDDLEQQNNGWPNDEHWTGVSVKVIGERLYAATDLT